MNSSQLISAVQTNMIRACEHILAISRGENQMAECPCVQLEHDKWERNARSPLLREGHLHF